MGVPERRSLSVTDEIEGELMQIRPADDRTYHHELSYLPACLAAVYPQYPWGLRKPDAFDGGRCYDSLKMRSAITTFIWSCYGTSFCCAFSGPQRHQQMKAEARMNTISTLLGQDQQMNQDNQSALQSLLKTDTYLSKRFSFEHTAFKSTHNDVFVQLVRHCSKPSQEDSLETRNYHPVFYLDGADGASTIALRQAGTCNYPNPLPLSLPLSSPYSVPVLALSMSMSMSLTLTLVSLDVLERCSSPMNNPFSTLYLSLFRLLTIPLTLML